MKNIGLALLSLSIIIVTAAGVSAFGRGNTEVREAIENEDYDAFKEAISLECEDRQSLERFDKMVEGHKNRKSIHEALEQNDYEAWIEAISALPHAPENFKETVTEADFEVLVQIHRLREEGNYEAAKVLREELGFEMPFRHKGKMHRMNPPSCGCMNSE